jgi:hypothetical protein
MRTIKVPTLDAEESFYEVWCQMQELSLNSFCDKHNVKINTNYLSDINYQAWVHNLSECDDPIKLFSYVLSTIFENDSKIPSEEHILNVVLNHEEFGDIHYATYPYREDIPSEWKESKFLPKKRKILFWKKKQPKFNKKIAVYSMVDFMLAQVSDYLVKTLELKN